MKRPPLAYLLIFGAIVAIGVLSVLVSLGVPPFDVFQVWIFSNVMAFFTLLLLGVLGGAAVGMLLAHRILSNRDFTPFERSVLVGLSEIRERLDRLEQERAPREREETRAAEKARR